MIKASSGNLYSLYVTAGATPGFLMTFNAKSVPSDGPVTPVECVAVPANSTVSVSFNGPPDIYYGRYRRGVQFYRVLYKDLQRHGVLQGAGAMRVDALVGVLCLLSAGSGWAQTIQYGPGAGVV